MYIISQSSLNLMFPSVKNRRPREKTEHLKPNKTRRSPLVSMTTTTTTTTTKNSNR